MGSEESACRHVAGAFNLLPQDMPGFDNSRRHHGTRM